MTAFATLAGQPQPRIDPLIAAAAHFREDPLGFVLWAFPWGEGDLAAFDGPDEWQRDWLADLGHMVRQRGFDGSTPVLPVQMATASGHGVGKSALVAWVILWILATRPHSRGVVTANTAAQLETKSWAELTRWHRRALIRDWFRMSSARGGLRLVHKKHPETWRVDGQTCREENSESFAGLHAAHSTPFYIFDEASAVPDVIWDVAEGGLTDGEPMWFVFGNPTRNTGRFHDCFGRYRHLWNTRRVDSRTARMTNKKLLDQWIRTYGADSDFVKVRVKGEFPHASSRQFISTADVSAAVTREAVSHLTDPLILGVDVARFGDDKSVIFARRGRDARTIAPQCYQGIDTMELAARVAQTFIDEKAVIAFVDEGGVGGGVVDRLHSLGISVRGVNFGSRADRGTLAETGASGERYANKRAEMWGVMRHWLRSGGAIPDHADLRDDLIAVEYGFRAEGEILLEKKDEMKRRGMASPDMADALALTFAWPVAPIDLFQDRELSNHAPLSHDYNPFD